MMTKDSNLKIIKGGYRKNTWFQDPDIPQQEIDLFNHCFERLSQTHDPRWAGFIWNPETRKPQLRTISGGKKGKSNPGGS